MTRAIYRCLLASLVWAAACGGGKAKQEEAGAGAGAAAVPAPAGSTATAQGRHAGAPVPSAMSEAEGAAEDVQDDIMVGNWTAARAKVDTLAMLKSAIAATGPAGNQMAKYSESLESLRSAVNARKEATALLSANRISRALNGMMSGYSMRVPIDVAYMDVSGRDLLYAARQRNWPVADSALAEIEDRYSGVQVHVALADSALDARVRADIARAHTGISARDPGPVQSAAKDFLDDVDRIEKTY